VALKEKEEKGRAGHIRSVSQQRRQCRERQDLREEELWTKGGFLRGSNRTISPISDELDANSRDAARLRRSRQQVSEGEVHWGVEDDESPKKSHAGG
jgi:hypothetical protein